MNPGPGVDLVGFYYSSRGELKRVLSKIETTI